MALRDLIFRIRARNESEEGIAGVEASWRDALGRMAGLSAAFAGEVASDLARIRDEIDNLNVSLERGLGATVGERGQEVLRALASDPTLAGSPEDLAAAVRAAAAIGFTGTEQDEALAGQFARFQTITGGDLTSITQLARREGLGAGGVQGILEQLVGTQQRLPDVGIGEILSGVRNYGPVLSQAGLDVQQQIEFIADLQGAGVDISRVGPGINQFIRSAAREGYDPAALLPGVFNLLEQGTEQEAIRVGEAAFGAEGTIRLTEAIRAGIVGLSGQQLTPTLPDASLAYLARPGEGEYLDTVRRAEQFRGGVGNVLGAASGALGDVPLIGGAFEAIERALINRPDIERGAPVTVINVNAGLVADEARVTEFIRAELSRAPGQSGSAGGFRNQATYE